MRYAFCPMRFIHEFPPHTYSHKNVMEAKGLFPYLPFMSSKLHSAFLLFLVFLVGCNHNPVSQKPKPTEPYFKPGEYGGDAMSGTEWITSVFPSPDGQKVAIVRYWTPSRTIKDPREQLWIVNKDGSDPRLIASNILNIDWSPQSNRLAVTYTLGIHVYIFLINLNNNSVKQLTGLPNSYFNKATVMLPKWFNDGNRILVSASAKAYQQSFERGFYIMNLTTDSVKGPLVPIAEAGQLGYHDRYITGIKYTSEKDSLSGNFIRYDFDTNKWHWLTHETNYTLKNDLFILSPSPTSKTVVYSKQVNNAPQIFVTNSTGTRTRQFTHLGGEYPNWSPDGKYFTFVRDIHKGPGAHYIVMKCTVSDWKISPLWPNLPDSVPHFPPVSTQHPIDLYSIVQQNQ
jgi:dipeptidyl aminopeptidase/acylaminoacyl peptidase